MPHNLGVSIPMLTVMETSAFTRRAAKLLTVDEYEDLLFYLALHAGTGDEIPGTGGGASCDLARMAEESPAAFG
jgi:hypothetical protein